MKRLTWKLFYLDLATTVIAVNRQTMKQRIAVWRQYGAKQK